MQQLLKGHKHGSEGVSRRKNRPKTYPKHRLVAAHQLLSLGGGGGGGFFLLAFYAISTTSTFGAFPLLSFHSNRSRESCSA